MKLSEKAIKEFKKSGKRNLARKLDKNTNYILRRKLIIKTKDDKFLEYLGPRQQRIFTYLRLDIKDLNKYTPEQLSRVSGGAQKYTIKKLAEEFGEDTQNIKRDLVRAEVKLKNLGCNTKNLSGFKLIKPKFDYRAIITDEGKIIELHNKLFDPFK